MRETPEMTPRDLHRRTVIAGLCWLGITAAVAALVIWLAHRPVDVRTLWERHQVVEVPDAQSPDEPEIPAAWRHGQRAWYAAPSTK